MRLVTARYFHQPWARRGKRREQCWNPEVRAVWEDRRDRSWDPRPRAAASVQGPCRGGSLGALDPKLPVPFPSLLPSSSLLFMLFQARGPGRPLMRSVQARTGRGGERMWRDKWKMSSTRQVVWRLGRRPAAKDNFSWGSKHLWKFLGKAEIGVWP